MNNGTGIYTTPEEIRLRKMRALIALFEKTNRILSGRSITCALNMFDKSAIAWTVGLGIQFSNALVGDINTPEDIVRLSGLNWHEYGHAMFSPNIGHGDELYSLVDGSVEAANAFNILEDQRIESMVAALYPPTRHYFTGSFVEIIMNRAETDNHGKPVAPDHSLTHLLAHGRRYLGDDVRKAIRDLFVDQSLAPSFEDVIDRFRVLNLNLPEDRKTAVVLIERWIELMKRLPQRQQQKMGKFTDKHSNAVVVLAIQGLAIQGAKQMSKEASDAVKNGDDQRGEGVGTGKSDEGDGEQGTDGKDGGGGNGEESEDDGDSGGKGYSEGGKSLPASDVNRDHGSSELNNAIANALSAILQDDEVKEDIRNSQRALKSAGTKGEAITLKSTFTNDSRPELVATARRMGRKLQQIVERQESGWDRRTPSGRLNVQRTMTMRTPDPDSMFDAWEEGNNDAASIEGTLLMDSSSSMGGNDSQLSNAAWAIKKAFDNIGAPLTVYEYNSDSLLVYKAEDRAKPGRFPNLRPRGGTAPGNAIVESGRRLMNSKHKKRVFIIMTDGVFGNYYDQYISDMTAAGVLTVFAYLYKTSGEIDMEHVPGHGCAMKLHIRTLDNLVDLTQGIVKSLLGRRR